MKKTESTLKRILAGVRPWLRRIYVLVRPDQAFRYVLYLGMGLSSRISSVGGGEKAGQMWVEKMSGGDCITRAMVDLASARAALEKKGYPLVSCLMVTRERFDLARRSVNCFLKQTYPNKELVIIDDDPCDDLERWVGSLRDPQIQFMRLADEGKPLGELREISLQAARGDYVSQWDDDDISHPDRLMSQLVSIAALHADAAFLHRQMLWFPGRRCLGISAYRLLENTMVIKKEKIGSYQALEKGEDTPLCNDVVREAEVVLCDKPDLYVYIFHGNNTWDEDHFVKIWERASKCYKGSDYDRVLIDLQKEFAVELDEHATGSAGVAQRDEDALARSVPPPASGSPDSLPRVLVLAPVKNATPHLQRFIDNLDAATYPKDKLSLAFLESDSDDDTYGEIEKMLPVLRERYERVELFKQDLGYRPSRLWGAGGEQFTRRSILARSRNLLMFSALRDEDWVLWMDAGLLSWPADMIERLLSAEENIVVPHCVKPDGDTFDLNTFVLDDNADQLDWSRYICDGILQPPIGYGRRYLGEFTNRERVEVDGVGGTVLLVRADIHRQGLVYPACAVDFHIEAEGLARMAKGMGYSPCGLPGLRVVHI